MGVDLKVYPGRWYFAVADGICAQPSPIFFRHIYIPGLRHPCVSGSLPPRCSVVSPHQTGTLLLHHLLQVPPTTLDNRPAIIMSQPHQCPLPAWTGSLSPAAFGPSTTNNGGGSSSSSSIFYLCPTCAQVHALLSHPQLPSPPETIHFNFGTIAPSSTPDTPPWTLTPKHAWEWDTNTYSSLPALTDTHEIHLHLFEEFLFDTFTASHTAARLAAAQNDTPVMPWPRILATLSRALPKTVRAVHVEVHGLGTESSMSDIGLGAETAGPGVLRPTGRVYGEFVRALVEFARALGGVEVVGLRGVFPADWERILEEGMGGAVRVEKDLSRIVDEVRWWTNPSVDAGEVLRVYGVGGPKGDWEGKLRRCHAMATRTMVMGVGEGNEDGEEEEDSVYAWTGA
ncbi:hypothetical protein B0T19DRAFT_146754 [Cercophora scortea]|uniref:Uncharacterized protein n=1 Tax=Cercophora scortea TaxID=314031 RepID=A0AAE0J073_9PEZI|nr:hypothetical protein B0T19DRAFT_146754 [Cercophora scortea]